MPGLCVSGNSQVIDKLCAGLMALILGLVACTPAVAADAEATAKPAKKTAAAPKVAAAEAIFGVVGDDLAAEYIVPSPLDPRVGPAVAAAVAAASSAEAV